MLIYCEKFSQASLPEGTVKVRGASQRACHLLLSQSFTLSTFGRRSDERSPGQEGPGQGQQRADRSPVGATGWPSRRPCLKVVTFGYVFVEDVERHSWKTCTPPTRFLGRREYI